MNIKVRHSQKEDISDIKNIYAQPSCYAGTLQLPYPSIDKWQNSLGETPDNFYSLVATDNEKVIGQVGMEVFSNPRRKHVSNIGMAVDEEFQNCGVGSKLLEAILALVINWLAIRRIELEVYTNNEGAIGLYKKFGFQIEGTAKNYAFRSGEFTDAHLMAKIV